MLTINYDTDESYQIKFNGAVLFTADHDADGWAGMERIRTAVTKVAEAAGIAVRETGDPNV